MNKIRMIAVGLAVAGLIGASADGCKVNPAPSSTQGVQVSASPQPTNGGVGQVSGVCHFSIKGPAADDTSGSGIKPKKMSPVLIGLAGIVWGYCTDTIHDFVIDLHIYAAPAGDAHGDFTKDPNAHELSHNENHTPPGPAPKPFAVTFTSCVPGLEYQLVWYITATDHAGNFIGGGPFGGQIVSFTAAQCGAVA